MFTRYDATGYKELLEKITMKTLVYGERTLLTEFKLGKGAILPTHSHPYEQTGYLVSGRIDLTIGNVSYQVRPGDSWCIPANVSHHAHARENSTAIEVFSPVREDYIPK
ncbi:MAG TPA: cupin domain-containing protein [Nitrospirota bacterium]|nr:cupin domain-containing protein [Nitrospirota bacterium]